MVIKQLPTTIGLNASLFISSWREKMLLSQKHSANLSYNTSVSKSKVPSMTGVIRYIGWLRLISLPHKGAEEINAEVHVGRGHRGLCDEGTNTGHYVPPFLSLAAVLAHSYLLRLLW